MNYFVIPVEDIDTAELDHLAYESPKGYITFFSLKNLNFYYIYRGGYKVSLTPNWRRGVPLHLFHELKFLKEVSPCDTRKIRRNDFKKVFNHLNQIQRKSNAWCHIQILSEQLTISHIGQEEVGFEVLFVQNSKVFKELCYEFLELIQKDTLQRRSPQERILSYKKKILKQEPLLERLSTLSSQSHRLIFTGFSYQLLSCIGKIFFKRPVIAMGLANRFHQQIKISTKIRKVIVLTNLAGGYLSALNIKHGWWDQGPQKILWKHIQGKFTKNRVNHLIEEEKILFNYDLLIYRGHGCIKNKDIHWQLEDGEYQLNSEIMSRYIHLSCLNISSPKDDLLNLPFKEGILPLGFFPDRDEVLFIKNIFKLIKNNRNFRDACQEALWQNKEYHFFSYWFS